MAATGRLKNVFGDSWVATKERVLGSRYQHCEDIDINEQVIEQSVSSTEIVQSALKHSLALMI